MLLGTAIMNGLVLSVGETAPGVDTTAQWPHYAGVRTDTRIDGFRGVDQRGTAWVSPSFSFVTGRGEKLLLRGVKMLYRAHESLGILRDLLRAESDNRGILTGH
jgi:hypothetical protein